MRNENLALLKNYKILIHIGKKMRHWSRLQKEVYKLIAPNINFQIHCIKYRMKSQYGNTSIPRYWITLGKEIIWDYPKDFIENKNFPYKTDMEEISNLLREYIDTPKEILYEIEFENDRWGLINILKAADRRIGTRRLKYLMKESNNIAVNRISKERIRINQECNENW